MNEDNWYQDSESDNADSRSNEGYAEPKKGMSTGMKVFIGIAIAGGVMALLCCGGLFYMGASFANMMTEDPVEIRALQDEIAGIEAPEELSPKMGMDFGMMGVTMKMVVYDDGGDTVLMLMQMSGPEGMSGEDLQRGFQQGLDQQGRNTDIDVKSSEERTVTIGEEEVVFDFLKGKARNGDEVRQVKGALPGRGGTSFLIYHCPEEDWDEDRVVQMLESIQN